MVASSEGDGARLNMTAVPAAGTIRSSEPTTKSDGTRSRRTAANADGAVSAAASVTTVSTAGLRAAASTATPPPIECPATARRAEFTFPCGTSVVPVVLFSPSQRNERLRSFASRPWLGNRPVSLSGAITTYPDAAIDLSVSAYQDERFMYPCAKATAG